VLRLGPGHNLELSITHGRGCRDYGVNEMTNVIDITTGHPWVIKEHLRIADKVAAIIQTEIPDAIDIRVEHIETICVCSHQDLYGPRICAGCPGNPDGGDAT
jgi:hypothetical protein